MAQAGVAIAGVAKGTGSTVGGLLKLLFFVRARWTITILLLTFSMFQAGTESFKQKSFAPLVFDVGGQLVSADENLYWYLRGVEANGWRVTSENIEKYTEDSLFWSLKSFGSKFALGFKFFSTFWYLYVVTYLFYWIVNRINTSAVFFSIIIAILIVVMLQAIYGSIMLYVNYNCDSSNLDKCIAKDERYKNALFSLTPAKGLGFFAVNMANGNLLTAFKESATPIINEVMFQ